MEKAMGPKAATIRAQTRHSVTALLDAAAAGDVAAIRLLLQQGADVNGQDTNQDSAIRKATAKDSLAAVRFLVEKGANVNVANLQGRTPLMEAAQNHKHDPLVGQFRSVCESGSGLREVLRSPGLPPAW